MSDFATPAFGNPRSFTETDSVVEAVPFVHGDVIQRVVITKMNGERHALERMKRDILQRYTGASYEKTWVGGTNG